ncbi:unnamed protein product [Phaeothamnion confervicola]
MAETTTAYQDRHRRRCRLCRRYRGRHRSCRQRHSWNLQRVPRTLEQGLRAATKGGRRVCQAAGKYGERRDKQPRARLQEWQEKPTHGKCRVTLIKAPSFLEWSPYLSLILLGSPIRHRSFFRRSSCCTVVHDQLGHALQVWLLCGDRNRSLTQTVDGVQLPGSATMTRQVFAWRLVLLPSLSDSLFITSFLSSTYLSAYRLSRSLHSLQNLTLHACQLAPHSSSFRVQERQPV